MNGAIGSTTCESYVHHSGDCVNVKLISTLTFCSNTSPEGPAEPWIVEHREEGQEEGLASREEGPGSEL